MSLVSIKLPLTSTGVCIELPDKGFHSDDMIECTVLLSMSDLPLGKGYCCVTLLDDEGHAIDRAENSRDDRNIDFEFVLTAETVYGTYNFDVDVVGSFWYINID